MKKTKRIVMAVILTVITFITIFLNENNKWLADNKSEAEAKKEQAEKEAQELEEAKSQLEEELDGMDSKLYGVSISITDLQQQIEEKQAAIEESNALLLEAQATVDEQYEAMKKRIQFTYENGSAVSWTILLESKNFGDFLNRASYMSEIAKKDRELLVTYQESVNQVNEIIALLEQENAELETAMTELQKQENSLLSSIGNLQSDIDSASEQIDDKNEMAEELSKQIAAMEAYEKQLEQSKKTPPVETAKEQEKEQEEKPPVPVSPSVGEEELFAALIYCEAGGESYAGQQAVASVVINRVNSSYFPNNITDVIYQSGQFSPAMSGKLALVLENNLTTESCRNAAKWALAGNRSGNWLYFRVNDGSVQGDVIDNQVFY